MLCPDIGRGCRREPYIESVLVLYAAAVALTLGRHFLFGSRNVAHMECREKDLRNENATVSDGRGERSTEFGGDITLLPGSDDLLRR